MKTAGDARRRGWIQTGRGASRRWARMGASLLTAFRTGFVAMRRLAPVWRRRRAASVAGGGDAGPPAPPLPAYPAGHYFSAMPSRAEVTEAFARGGFGPPFRGIALNEAAQLERLERFAAYYPEQPFPELPVAGRRFHLANPAYAHFDALMLYSMLREARPRRVIEVGSGFSSAAMLDFDEHANGNAIAFTFIDPDMSRLRPLLREHDRRRCTLIERRVQDVPLEAFAALGENDVLFIDSSHISKVGSDVNRLYFDVLPSLARGVLIHIHDVSGTLEYPREWFEEGRGWNEQYVLRAFLMHNAAFRIELFSAWLFDTRHAWFRERMPLCTRGGGGQLWLRKLTDPA